MQENLRYIDGYSFAETEFDPGTLAKTESIMSLGNGYLGLRASAEESYVGETRGLFVAGTFNRFDENEVTELPNAADVVATEITLEGQTLDFTLGKLSGYEKKLDMRRGLLARRADWEIDGRSYSFEFSRFVSAAQLHTVGQKITLRAGQDTTVRLVAGFNGRTTNSGSQHFTDGDKRFIDKKYLQMVTQTTEKGIPFYYTMALRLFVDGQDVTPPGELLLGRRRLQMGLSFTLKAGQRAELVKLCDIRTGMDLDSEGLTPDEIKQKALNAVKQNSAKGFAALLAESAEAMEQRVWRKAPIEIESENPFDALAVHFAQYHLHCMTPAHDSRMNIGAKGLAGEGYKGHSFWDTEIFLLPYFTFTNPETARKLAEYRCRGLAGARRKAKENGYDGAQYPWESAAPEDGEVTPVWGPADVVTGLPMKIETGFIEQHITADVAFGIWQYYLATGDEAFMLDCGYEIILDTAKFWASRVEYCDTDGLYHINDVMGPDEFKEHVDDNAYTNYMAWWNMKLALQCYEKLEKQHPDVFERLDKALGLRAAHAGLVEKTNRLYLPKPRQDGVLPQDKTYLGLKDIDLAKYKGAKTGSIYKDYNAKQISEMQVSKQADVLLLVLLQAQEFTEEAKRASWNYYEPRTLHDSSLSLSTHSVLASELGERALAYEMFERACRIDLGQNMHSSDDGIHAASMGGIWQMVVFGFGGVHVADGELVIKPRMPKQWSRLAFTLYWKGERLLVEVDGSGKAVIQRKDK